MTEYNWNSIFAVHEYFAKSDISYDHLNKIWYGKYDPWLTVPLTCFGLYKEITGHYFKQTVSSGKNSLYEIKYLFLTAMSLEDIYPIRELTNLEIIDSSLNNIDSLVPIKNLKHLKRVDFTQNKISNLEPLSNLTDLETLWLQDNRITDISPLFQLINLKELWLAGNKIQDIRFLSKLKQLKKLDLSYNQIGDIDELANLKNLEVLKLNGNNLNTSKVTALGKSLRKCKIFFGSEDIELDSNPWSGYLYFKIINDFEVPFLVNLNTDQNVRHTNIALIDKSFKSKINAIEEMKNICRTLVNIEDRNDYVIRDIKRELFFEETHDYVRAQFDY
jgi:internalin A